MFAVSKTVTPRSIARSTIVCASAALVRLPKFIVPSAIAVIGTVYSAPAAAHSLGVSTGSISVAPDGHVDADLVFAASELAGAVALDKNHDGVVTEDEAAAANPDLRALMTIGTEIDADGSACAATSEEGALVAGDGIELRASYACPSGARTIGVTLFFLSQLSPQHRHALELTAGARTVEKVLSGTSRYASIDLAQAGGRRTLAPWKQRAVVWLTIAFGVWMTALFVWRWRRASRERPPRARW